MSAPNALPRGLYGVVDVLPGERDEAVMDRMRFLTDQGVAVAQLRAKGLGRERMRTLASACVGLTPLLIVNDHPDIASGVGAWTHVGQEDGEDPTVPFGRSTHTLEQVALPGSATYLGFGPIFSTRTKQTGYDPRGIDLLAEAVRLSTVPIVAIGGIDVRTIDMVRATGVHGWAVIGGFWQKRHDSGALRHLLSA